MKLNYKALILPLAYTLLLPIGCFLYGYFVPPHPTPCAKNWYTPGSNGIIGHTPECYTECYKAVLPVVYYQDHNRLFKECLLTICPDAKWDCDK
jgi:hypothetical protein